MTEPIPAEAEAFYVLILTMVDGKLDTLADPVIAWRFTDEGPRAITCSREWPVGVPVWSSVAVSSSHGIWRDPGEFVAWVEAGGVGAIQ